MFATVAGFLGTRGGVVIAARPKTLLQSRSHTPANCCFRSCKLWILYPGLNWKSIQTELVLYAINNIFQMKHNAQEITLFIHGVSSCMQGENKCNGVCNNPGSNLWFFPTSLHRDLAILSWYAVNVYRCQITESVFIYGKCYALLWVPINALFSLVDQLLMFLSFLVPIWMFCALFVDQILMFYAFFEHLI